MSPHPTPCTVMMEKKKDHAGPRALAGPLEDPCNRRHLDYCPALRGGRLRATSFRAKRLSLRILSALGRMIAVSQFLCYWLIGRTRRSGWIRQIAKRG
jgi:hypothetical protein